MEMLDLNAVQAGSLLKSMIEAKDLIRISGGVSTRYIRYQENIELPPYSQEEKVIDFAKDREFVTNKEVQNLLSISNGAANVLLCGMQ